MVGLWLNPNSFPFLLYMTGVPRVMKFSDGILSFSPPLVLLSPFLPFLLHPPSSYLLSLPSHTIFPALLLVFIMAQCVQYTVFERNDVCVCNYA